MVDIGCPNPTGLPDGPACGCPDNADGTTPRHWAFQGVAFFCACGPRRLAPDSDVWWEASPDGFACSSCAWSLPDRSLMRRLVCDMTCCWCGGVALQGRGWRVYGHPANGGGTVGLLPAGTGAAISRADTTQNRHTS